MTAILYPLATVDTPGFSSLGTVKAPLTSDVEYWVDSATGSDSNAGTQLAPWLTLQRALDERAKYGALQASFTIHLVGAGPYTMATLADSAADETGYFQIVGDITAKTALYSGTFTGGFGAGTIATTAAGVGAVDTQARKFLRITSGLAVGAEFMVVENTDTSVTISNNYAITTLGDVVNGDTFEIFQPATEIVLPDYTLTQPMPGIRNVRGYNASPNPYLKAWPKHWLRLVKLTCTPGGASGRMWIDNASIGFSTVWADASILLITSSQVMLGAVSVDALGKPVASGTGALLYASGLTAPTGAVVMDYGASTNGFLCWKPALPIYVGEKASATFVLAGGRGGHISARAKSEVYTWCASGTPRTVIENLTCSGAACITVSKDVAFLNTPTNLELILVVDGGNVQLVGNVTGQATGTRVAIYVRGHGAVNANASVPGITGSTPGNDIQVPGVAVQAIGILSAAGTGVVSPTTGGAVCRQY